jgi:hypothetical protein
MKDDLDLDMFALNKNVRAHDIHMHAKYEVSTCFISKDNAKVTLTDIFDL